MYFDDIDWYHEDSYTNLEQYMNRENIDGVEPIPRKVDHLCVVCEEG